MTGGRRLVLADVDVAASVPQVVTVLVLPVKRQPRHDAASLLEEKQHLESPNHPGDEYSTYTAHPYPNTPLVH